jgi:hypothetical protein
MNYDVQFSKLKYDVIFKFILTDFEIIAGFGLIYNISVNL